MSEQTRERVERIAGKYATSIKTRIMLEEALTALAEEEQPKWLPIESAPKDWSSIILFCPDSDPQVLEGYYSCFDGGSDQWTTRDGDRCEPTHWQPLPNPPGE